MLGRQKVIWHSLSPGVLVSLLQDKCLTGEKQATLNRIKKWSP